MHQFNSCLFPGRQIIEGIDLNTNVSKSNDSNQDVDESPNIWAEIWQFKLTGSIIYHLFTLSFLPKIYT
jgi:hypothetical protein